MKMSEALCTIRTFLEQNSADYETMQAFDYVRNRITETTLQLQELSELIACIHYKTKETIE